MGAWWADLLAARARHQPFTLHGMRPLTRAERTNFEETSLNAGVVAFIDDFALSAAALASV